MQVMRAIGLGLVVLQLVACATPVADYQPPDPLRQATARLWILADPGVRTEVRIHPGQDDDCLDYAGARRVPMSVGVPVSDVHHGDQSALPRVDGDADRAATGVLISAAAPLTLSATYVGKDEARMVACTRALRFTPSASRDYRLYVAPDPRNGTQAPACTLTLNEVPPDFSGDPADLPGVDSEAIAVRGSPMWKARCATAVVRDQ